MKSVFNKSYSFNKLSIGKLLLLVLPIVIVIVFIFISYKSPIAVIHSEATDTIQKIHMTPFDDKVFKGKSECEILNNTSRSLKFKYTIKEGYVAPFAGISYAANDSELLNLANYDYVKIKIRSKNGHRIPFVLSTFLPSFSKPGESLTYRNLQSIINVSDQFQELEIPFKDLKTPDWWYIVNNKKEADFQEPDFSKVKYIHIAHCLNSKYGVEDIVEVENITFHVDMVPFYIYSGIVLLIYYLSLGVILVIKDNSNKKQIKFQNEHNATVVYNNGEEEAVFNFLTTNYNKESLSISDIQIATQISERNISQIIKQKTGLSYKEFLNQLRLFEAKRLLTETDLQITEIAYKVGYGNVSHFNRIFKSCENCSPNIYRKENSKVVSKKLDGKASMI